MDGVERRQVDGPDSFDGCVVPARMVMFVVEDDEPGVWVGVFMSARVLVEGGRVDPVEVAYQRAERRLRERRAGQP